MDTPQSNKMDPCHILNLFLESEVNYHTYNSGQNLLININIGMATAGKIHAWKA